MLHDATAFVAALGGLLLGAFGLYLNYRGRAASLRDRLYSDQIALLTHAIESAYECYVGCANAQRLGNNSELVAQIRRERGADLAALQKASFRASALLPSETGRLLYAYVGAVNEILMPSQADAAVPQGSQVRESFWAFVQAARQDLGIDALSKDTRDLFQAVSGGGVRLVSR
jgi:hypothetical protein